MGTSSLAVYYSPNYDKDVSNNIYMRGANETVAYGMPSSSVISVGGSWIADGELTR